MIAQLQVQWPDVLVLPLIIKGVTGLAEAAPIPGFNDGDVSDIHVLRGLVILNYPSLSDWESELGTLKLEG